jgi:peptidoglycan-N-acetylglucosamine deacetylase
MSKITAIKNKYQKFSKENRNVILVILFFVVILNLALIINKIGFKNNVYGRDLKLTYQGKIFTVNNKDVSSQTFLNLKLLEIEDYVNKDATPNTPDFQNNISTTLPEKDGVKVNTDKLTVLISENIKNPPLNPITVPVIKTFAGKYSEDDLNGIRTQAIELAKAPLTITTNGLIFTLTSKDLYSLLVAKEKPDPRDPQKITLALRLDDGMLNKKLGDFAASVENLSHSEYDDHSARVAIYSQFFGNYRKPIEVPTGTSGNLDYSVLGASVDNSGQKKVYLTFDDGPNPIYHTMILDILKKYNIKASFFLIGKNAVTNPSVTQRTLAEGHKIGNHSYTHPFLPNESQQSIYSELTQTDDALKNILGLNVKMFRPPYGGVNLYVKQTADNLGLKLYLWDVDPKDWSEPSTDELVRRVISNTKNGSDILLHSNHLVTAQALPRIIETLQSEGYSFALLN